MNEGFVCEIAGGAVSLWAGEAESEYGKTDHAPGIEVKEELGKPTRGMKRYQKRSESQDG